MENMNVIFEKMAEEHGAEVLEIFNYYVENGFAAYQEMRLPQEYAGVFLKIAAGYPAYVMKDAQSGRLAGFCFLHAFRKQPVFKKTAEVTYFIAREATGQGIGTRALALLESDARAIGIKHIIANVSSKNHQSIAFHTRNGFAETGRLRGIGEKAGEAFDVVWMQKSLA